MRALERLYNASKAEWDAESRALGRPCQFMFHGADIMIDAEGTFWLLEVNRCASISLVGPENIKAMSKAMLSEMVDIELEIREMKMNGQRVDQDTELESVRLWKRCRLDYSDDCP